MELLSYTFVQYAFIGGALMALITGIMGPFVVQSRQSIASDMFAHIALAGIGLALIAGVAPWWGALPILLLTSTLIWWLSEKNVYSPDALAMFFLSGGLALALALVHLAEQTTFSFETYLFGSILTLSSSDLHIMTIATCVVMSLVYVFWYPLIGATQQPSYRLPYRRTPQYIRLVYVWLLAVVVWIGIKTIGGLLIGALLVIPVLVARPFCRSFAQVTVGATMVAILSVLNGLTLALFLAIPPSSLIIGVLLTMFVLSNIVSRIASR